MTSLLLLFFSSEEEVKEAMEKEKEKEKEEKIVLHRTHRVPLPSLCESAPQFIFCSPHLGFDGLGEREDVNVVVRTFVSARVLEIELGREGPIQLEEEVQAQAQSPESGQALASAVGALQEQI